MLTFEAGTELVGQNAMSIVDSGGGERSIPLVIDLDGTLIKSDLLIETAFHAMGTSAARSFEALSRWRKGRAQLKKFLADSDINFSSLPYDPAVLAVAGEAVDAGRQVYLASGSDEKLVQAVANHLGIFSGWFASDGSTNLSGEAKAQCLVSAFGAGGFDYVGNSAKDLAIWAVCRKRFAIRVPAGVRDRLVAIDPDAEVLPHDRAGLATWARLLRVHQWTKNVLVLVPLLTSHNFNIGAILHALGAMVAFSLCASGVYILNDLADLDADRSHPTKRNRPLAAGEISLSHGLILVPTLILASLLLAAGISTTFLVVLGGYLLLTTAYTFFLKRRVIVDVVSLATLYTLRVVAGGEAIGVVVSEWLLGFSIFIFMSLALIKRYVELSQRQKLSLPDPPNRNYRTSDLPIIAALAAASAFNAITLFALYLSSDVVHRLYRHPQFLWLICPILMYWTSRALMIAHRDAMNDDPIVFSLKDRVSRIVILVMVALVLISI
jgi:4-hydroxybenzoate polyprenyltransferase